MMQSPSLTLGLTLFSLFCCLSNVQSLTTCDNDRPGQSPSLSPRRKLILPESMMLGSYDEEIWANALCCVYTHVTKSKSVTNPSFEAYDGSSYSIVGDTAVKVMEQAMDEVCEMYMGKQDCSNQAACVNNALNSGCVDSPLVMLVREKKRDCGWTKAKNLSKRCGRRKISSHCPRTCSSCDEFMSKDSEKSFVMKKSGFDKFCKWVGRNGVEKTEKRCAKYGVAITCRETCSEYSN